MSEERQSVAALDRPAGRPDAEGSTALVHRVRALPSGRYALIAAALAAVTLGLGASGVASSPSGLLAAPLWPVVGVAAALALLLRGPFWQSALVLAALLIAGPALAGAPVTTAVLLGVALTIEALTVRLILGGPPRSWLLDSRRALTRLLLASSAAAVLGSALVATIALLQGGALTIDGMLVVLSAHLAALLAVVPLTVVQLPRWTLVDRRELIVQTTVTLMASALVLVIVPDLRAVILLAPLLAWAAMRFPPVMVSAQLIAVGVIGDASVMAGTGLVAVEGPDAVASVVLLHLGVVALAVMIHVIAVVRIERMTQRAENDRRAALLRRGLDASRVGTVLVKPDAQTGVSIVDVNEVAERVIGEDWFERLISAWLDSEETTLSTEVALNDGRTIQVQGQRVLTDDGDSVLAVQLVDVTAFVEAREAMAQAVAREREMIDKLHALARQKEDFVAAVSHELRTPLTSIMGFAEDLDQLPPEELQEATEVILRNSARLTEMVEDLLELGRMTTPNPVRETGSFDLSSIVGETVADQRKAAAERQVTIEVVPSSEPAMVVSSSNALGRIATNLVSNAIKFAPIGGTVRVVTRVTDDTVEMVVEDSGPGISADDESRVFERFYRSADPERRRTPGTGLGLSIVKSLVELLHGTIAVGHSELGGARMGVSLPRDRAS